MAQNVLLQLNQHLAVPSHTTPAPRAEQTGSSFLDRFAPVMAAMAGWSDNRETGDRCRFAPGGLPPVTGAGDPGPRAGSPKISEEPRTLIRRIANRGFRPGSAEYPQRPRKLGTRSPNARSPHIYDRIRHRGDPDTVSAMSNSVRIVLQRVWRLHQNPNPHLPQLPRATS